MATSAEQCQGHASAEAQWEWAKGSSAAGLATCQWSISPICLTFLDVDCTEIKNKFVAARSRLPVMFIATPKDKWNSIWTQERPSAQVSWGPLSVHCSACCLGAFLYCW